MEDFFGAVACEGEDLGVAGQVGYFQSEGDAALLRALDVAGATEAHIGLGYGEAVGCGAHGLDAASGVVAEFVGGHEDAIALVGAAPHTASELVELAKAEAFGALDDHYRGVGDIDTHLDDRRGDHDLCLTGYELLHGGVFIGGFEFAVDHADVVFGETLLHVFVAGLEVFIVHALVLLDEGEDDVALSSFLEFGAHEGVEFVAVAVVVVFGENGFATWWHLVDDAHVEVAVDGHGEGAWDRCGCHDEDVWWACVFCPEHGALLNAEAVLLVDDA